MKASSVVYISGARRVLLAMAAVLLISQLTACGGSYQPLHNAVQAGEIEKVRSLLDEGADINVRSFGVTPLYRAIWKGQTEAVKLLIERGADMNVKDSNGTTPLQMAVYNGRAEAVKLLIERGADINAKNNKGETALDIARRRNKRVIAGIIQEAIDRDLRTQQEAKDRRLELAQQEEDDRAFKVAGSADTIDAWSAYLKTNPSSQHRKDALKGLAVQLIKAKNPPLTSSMARTYPGLLDHIPLKDSLAFIGPPGLTVAEMLEIKQQGMSDMLITAQVMSAGAAYRKFSFKEIMELKNMGLSDEVIKAMVDVTTKAHAEQAQANYMKKLESLNAEQRAKLEEIELKMDELQKAQATTVSVSSTSGTQGSDASSCAARTGAVLLCKQTTGGLLQLACVSAAKAKYPCN